MNCVFSSQPREPGPLRGVKPHHLPEKTEVMGEEDDICEAAFTFAL